MEQPPILPDHHADAALDGWFGKARADLNRWDVVGMLFAVVGALASVALVPLP